MLLSVSATTVFVILMLTSRGVLTSSASRYDHDRYQQQQQQQQHDSDTLKQYGQGKPIKNATPNLNVHCTSRGVFCY